MSLEYKTLVVWQRADDLFIDIHRLTYEQFPRDEQFELGRRIRRAAYSVPANIVEGSDPHVRNDRWCRSQTDRLSLLRRRSS